MKLKFLSGIFSILLPFTLWSQSTNLGLEGINTTKVISPSPTASSIGKYGNLPVGLYTGSPEVKIPIYDIGLSDLKLPVFLNYSGGGIKVAEMASWVGLGWALNAGGAITRITQGLPDEIRLYNTNQAINLNASQNEAPEYIENIKDGQLDIFYFNFLGRSGRFVLDASKKAYISADQKIIIQPTKYESVLFPDMDGYQSEMFRYVITEWKIVDENGIEYYFSDYEPTKSYPRVSGFGGQFLTDYGNSAMVQATVNAWQLSKIITPGGNQVQFTYESKKLVYDMPSEERRYIVQNTFPQEFSSQVKSGSITSQRLCVGTKQLKEISFLGGKILFSTSLHSRADLIGDNYLQTITVLNNESQVCKKYLLKYGYLQSASITDADLIDPIGESNFYDYAGQYPPSFNRRLLLQNIQQVSSDLNVIDQYKFEYFADKGLPARVSGNCADHWGYANKTYSQTTDLLPVFLKRGSDFIIYGKEPSYDYAKQGTLKRIIYPTGGNTEFTYELHTSNSPVLPKPIRTKAGVGLTINYSNFNNLPYNSVMGYCDLYADPITRKQHYVDFTIDDYYGGNLPLKCAVQNFPENPGLFGYYLVNIGNGTTVWHMDTDFLLQLQHDPNLHVFNGEASLPYLPNGTYRLYHYPAAGSFPTYSLNIKPWDEVFNPSQRTVGGIRIKENLDFDPVTNKKIKTAYTYVTDGEILSIPKYQYDYSERLFYNLTGLATYYFNLQYKVLSSSLSYPLSNTQGSFVGYKVVEEKKVNDITAAPLGKTVFTYTSPNLFPDIYGENVKSNLFTCPYPFAPADNFDWLRGKLIEQHDYAYSDGSYQLIKKATNKYEAIIPSQYISSVVYGYILKDQETFRSSFDIIGKQVYSFTSGTYVLTETNSEDYSNGSSLLTTTKYKYNSENFLPFEISTTSSDGKVNVLRKKFPIDYKNITQQDAFSSSISQLQLKHIISPEIENTLMRGTSEQSIKVYSSIFKKYYPDLPLLNGVYKFNNSAGITNFSGTDVINGAVNIDNRYEELLKFNRYDNYGNLLEQQKTDDLKQSYVWGYYSQYPIAEVINAPAKDIFHTSFEDGEGNSANGDGKTGKKSKTGGYQKPLSNLTNGSYILSYWQKSGDIWNLQSSPILITGSAYTINLTGQVDEVRFYPAAAQMTTYTYTPLIGMTTQCDVNNRISYYEYDGFNRLAMIRDQYKNIVKRFCYNYAGQPGNCN